jgi:hypothetical protein
MLPLRTERHYLAAGLLFAQVLFSYIEVAGIRWNKLFSTNPAEPPWKLCLHTPSQRWRATLARQLIVLVSTTPQSASDDEDVGVDGD